MEIGSTKLAILNFLFKSLELFWNSVLRCFVRGQKGLIPPTTDDILLQPAVILAEQIRTKRLKSEVVVRTFVKRIQSVNPVINAVVDERFADAIQEARLVDEYIENYQGLPESLQSIKPLLGVPFTTKNSIGVEGLVCDAGLYYLKGLKAKKDCETVKLMREAGAIPLLVSNVPEYCVCYDASNVRYGRTNNPYDLARVTGGSSGGEGALLASASSVIGFGSDIGGSVRGPAYSCGIFAHKTSKGIVSNEGQFPTTHGTVHNNYNCTGPMCRYADDLIPVLKVLAGKNINRLKLDSEVDVKKLKIFYIVDYSSDAFVSRLSPEMRISVEQVVNYLEKICETKPISINYVVPQAYHNSMYYTTKTQGANFDLTVELVTGKKRVSIRTEIIKSIFGQSKHTLFILLWLALRDAVRTWPKFYFERNASYLEDLRRQLDNLLGDDGVMVVASQPQPHYYHLEKLFKILNESYLNIFNLLGYPVTQCPIGLNDEGLPLGVQLVSKTNNDHLPIAVSIELQSAFGGWRRP